MFGELCILYFELKSDLFRYYIEIIMPKNVEVAAEDIERLEEGGGLAKTTLKDRERHYRTFLEFLSKETGGDGNLEDMLKSEEGRDELSNVIGRFFFTMRVDATDDGQEKLPKRKYAEKVRSSVKCSIQSLYRVDITDPCLFPQAAKRWKAFMAELVDKNRAETKHHEEVDPVTVKKIYDLLGNVKIAAEARGREDFDDKLEKVPWKLRNKLHYVLQWGAELVLEMYEVRRGGENMENLKKKYFQIIEDNIYDFKYIRKVVSEKEKNAAGGSNSACHGVIPFLDMSSGYNPGEYMEFYMSLLPDESTKEGLEGGFLFPKPRQPSRKFNMQDPDQKMYEPNQKGNN